MIKLSYKLMSVLFGVGGGLVARALFTKIWAGLTGEDEKPEANDRRAGWTEVLIAAALEGALFAVVRALVDRASAVGIEKTTGTWPE
jgi:Protein of unknown function (DUF4235)